MKKSISIWSFYGNWNLDEKLRLTKAAGFEGFEIDLSEDGPVNLGSTAADLKAVRALAEQDGVVLSGLATGLYWGANACSEDPAVRQKAAAILQKQIECAAALGIDAILVVPGAVGVDFIPGGEVVPYQICLGAGEGIHWSGDSGRREGGSDDLHRERLEQVPAQPAGNEGVH